MPALALVLIDSLLKVAGGVAIGWLVRDATAAKARSTKTVKAKAKPASAAPSLPARVPRPVEELKMVLCVNMALKMGGGKIGAQCAHAAVGVLRDNYQGPFYVQIKQWEMCAEPKIALKVPGGDDEMLALRSAARELGLPTYQVHDAGRTQIPAGSKTVLAIGPAPKSQVDKVTGHLKLL